MQIWTWWPCPTFPCSWPPRLDDVLFLTDFQTSLNGKEECSGKWTTDLYSGKLDPTNYCETVSFGRQTADRPDYNPVLSLLFRSHHVMCSSCVCWATSFNEWPWCGSLKKSKNCSLPQWILIGMLECYIEFVWNVVIYEFDIWGEFDKNVEFPKSFLSHKFNIFKMFFH